MEGQEHCAGSPPTRPALVPVLVGWRGCGLCRHWMGDSGSGKRGGTAEHGRQGRTPGSLTSKAFDDCRLSEGGGDWGCTEPWNSPAPMALDRAAAAPGSPRGGRACCGVRLQSRALRWSGSAAAAGPAGTRWSDCAG